MSFVKSLQPVILAHPDTRSGVIDPVVERLDDMSNKP